MGIREEQREKRYKEILSVALDLFIEKGYHAAKISDITKAVGMSTGLLFHYFKSKEALFEELIKIGMSGPASVLPSEEDEPIAYLENTAVTILSSLKENSFAAKMFLLMGQVHYMESVSEDVKLKLMELDIYTPTVALMKRGQQEGIIREGDPYAMSTAYWCSIRGICEQLAILPDAPCPKGEWIVDMFRKSKLE